MLRRAFERVEPWLAPLDPDLGLRLELERRVVQRADPDLDDVVVEAQQA